MKFPPGPVTNALILINVAISAILFLPDLFGQKFWEAAVVAGGLFPARLSGEAVAFAGVGYMVPAFLTPLTAAFLHGGIAHVVLNMLMLLLVGKFVERVLGAKLYLLLYFVGAYAAALAEWIVAPNSMTVIIGASGAMSAIIGAYALLFPNREPRDWGPIPASIARPLHLILAWTALNLMLGFVGPGIGLGIAIWSHIGGFFAGILLARPLLLWRYRKA